MSSTTMRSHAADPGDGAGDRPVGLGLADRGGEGLQGVPGDAQVLLDRGVGEGLDQVRLPGPGRAGDHEVLGPADPFQGDQGVLGGLGDGGFLRPPGGERLAGGEGGCLAAHAAGGGVASGDFLGEQDTEDLSGFPSLRAGGGEYVGRCLAQVGQPHPAEEGVELGRAAAGRRGRSPGPPGRGRGSRA